MKPEAIIPIIHKKKIDINPIKEWNVKSNILEYKDKPDLRTDVWCRPIEIEDGKYKPFCTAYIEIQVPTIDGKEFKTLTLNALPVPKFSSIDNALKFEDMILEHITKEAQKIYDKYSPEDFIPEGYNKIKYDQPLEFKNVLNLETEERFKPKTNVSKIFDEIVKKIDLNAEI